MHTKIDFIHLLLSQGEHFFKLPCLALRYESALNKDFCLSVQAIKPSSFSETATTPSWGKVIFSASPHKQIGSMEGLVTYQQTHKQDSASSYLIQLELRPELSWLQHNRRSGVFYAPTLMEVLHHFHQGALACHEHFRCSFNLSSLAKIPHFQLTQYNEPDRDFLDRQLRRHGVSSVWFQTGLMPVDALEKKATDSAHSDRPMVYFLSDNTQNFPRYSQVLEVVPKEGAQTPGISELSCQIKAPLCSTLRGIYHDEHSGKTSVHTVESTHSDPRTDPGTTWDFEIPFTTLQSEQIEALTKRAAESLFSTQQTITGKFKGHWLQPGLVVAISGAKGLPEKNYLILDVRYSFLSEGDPDQNTLQATSFKESHEFTATLLTAYAYRPPLVEQRRWSGEPKFSGLMPGVFAKTSGTYTVTADTQGRIPLRFPLRYQIDCDLNSARYTRICSPVHDGEAGFSFPYFADTEFLVGFASGSLDKPIIVGTAATGKTRHLHSNTLQQRSAIALPQGQRLVYTNQSQGLQAGLTIGANHTQGTHETFIYLNNHQDPNSLQKNADFVEATTAHDAHHLTGNLKQELAAKWTAETQ